MLIYEFDSEDSIIVPNVVPSRRLEIMNYRFRVYNSQNITLVIDSHMAIFTSGREDLACP